MHHFSVLLCARCSLRSACFVFFSVLSSTLAERLVSRPRALCSAPSSAAMAAGGWLHSARARAGLGRIALALEKGWLREGRTSAAHKRCTHAAHTLHKRSTNAVQMQYKRSTNAVQTLYKRSTNAVQTPVACPSSRGDPRASPRLPSCAASPCGRRRRPAAPEPRAHGCACQREDRPRGPLSSPSALASVSSSLPLPACRRHQGPPLSSSFRMAGPAVRTLLFASFSLASPASGLCGCRACPSSPSCSALALLCAASAPSSLLRSLTHPLSLCPRSLRPRLVASTQGCNTRRRQGAWRGGTQSPVAFFLSHSPTPLSLSLFPLLAPGSPLPRWASRASSHTAAPWSGRRLTFDRYVCAQKASMARRAKASWKASLPVIMTPTTSGSSGPASAALHSPQWTAAEAGAPQPSTTSATRPRHSGSAHVCVPLSPPPPPPPAAAAAAALRALLCWRCAILCVCAGRRG